MAPNQPFRLDKDSSNLSSRPLRDATALFNVDIINIYRLGGTPYKTWTHNNGKFWLYDFVPNEFLGARIYTFGYDKQNTLQSTDPWTQARKPWADSRVSTKLSLQFWIGLAQHGTPTSLYAAPFTAISSNPRPGSSEDCLSAPSQEPPGCLAPQSF